jgi:DNA polymerase III subunit epsilon
MSLLNKRLRDTPFASIDLETTGLSPKGGARIVEVSVVRVDPGCHPALVLDTLVDPNGPVLCTSIHGITDEDVVGAPTFQQVVGALIRALEGTLVGAFNASFDMSFLSAEGQLAHKGLTGRLPPHVCLMWMRPLLGLSQRCTLEAACQQHGLRAGTHRAAEDALACAHMWCHYVEAAERRGIKTLADLKDAGTHKYLSTLEWAPYSQVDLRRLEQADWPIPLKPRSQSITPPTQQIPAGASTELDARARVRMYWRALVDALSDDQLTSREWDGLRTVQTSISITAEEIRAVHARVFSDRLREYAEDLAVSAAEAKSLTALRNELGRLGWAP